MADALEWSEADVADVRRIAMAPVSLEAPVGDAGDAELGHLLADEGPTPDESAAVSRMHADLGHVLAGLGGLERRVLELRFGLGAEGLDEATRDLQRELSELDIEVSRPTSEAPPGTRAVEVAALGSLVVKAGSAALAPVARVLQGWLARRSGRTIKLTLGSDSIEISGGSAAYQQEMIETFLRARAD